MEDLMTFFEIYGWQLALIAILGIFVLGVLKYKNAFKNVKKEKRKLVYLTITVGFSIVAAIIYLLTINQFTVKYALAVGAAIYGLNQTFYTIYENTSLRDLMYKLLEFLKTIIKKQEVE